MATSKHATLTVTSKVESFIRLLLSKCSMASNLSQMVSTYVECREEIELLSGGDLCCSIGDRQMVSSDLVEIMLDCYLTSLSELYDLGKFENPVYNQEHRDTAQFVLEVLAIQYLHCTLGIRAYVSCMIVRTRFQDISVGNIEHDRSTLPPESRVTNRADKAFDRPALTDDFPPFMVQH